MGSFFSSPVSPPPQAVPTYGALPPYVQAYLQNATNFLNRQVGQVTPYTGPFTAPVTPQTQAGITDIFNQAQQAAGLPAYALPALASYASGQQLMNNPFIPSMISSINAITNQQLQGQLADLQQKFAAMGQGNGTPLMDAEARLYGQVIPGEVGAIGNILANQYGQGVQTQMGAIQQALGYPYQVAQGLMQAGQVPQQTQQALYSAWYNEFQRRLQQPYAPLGAAPPPFSLTAPTTYQPTFGPPPAAGLFNAAASYFGARA